MCCLYVCCKTMLFYKRIINLDISPIRVLYNLFSTQKTFSFDVSCSVNKARKLFSEKLETWPDNLPSKVIKIVAGILAPSLPLILVQIS